MDTELKTLGDAEFAQLQESVTDESFRRSNLNNIKIQLTELIKQYNSLGGSAEDLDGILNPNKVVEEPSVEVPSDSAENVVSAPSEANTSYEPYFPNE